MNQRTHAWIAIRALKLIEDEQKEPNLVELLKMHSKEASIGSWIPDKRDAKLGSASTQNHVFKISPYLEKGKGRYIVKKRQLINWLGPERMITKFITDYGTHLDDTWWGKSYKANPSPGKHLANRAMALTINDIDMLIVADDIVQKLLPKKIDFINKVADRLRTNSGQISLFFFMLSHFIADSLMPCHCDERDLSDYDNGLHMEMEKYWSSKIGTSFDENQLINSNLSVNQISEQAKNTDEAFGIKFNTSIPELKSDDIWEEVVLLCRASFTIASIIAPPSQWPYKPAEQKRAPFSQLFEGTKGEILLSEMTKAIMHDAVLNVAILWKHIWLKFKSTDSN
jgi:hypothetical protein